MSNLILPQKWTSQPQTPVEIDWSNPITNRIISVQDASGVDHVTGMGTFTGSARVKKYSPMGQGVLFGADTLTFPLAPYSGTINDSLVWVGSRSLVGWAAYGMNNGLGLTTNGSNLGIANQHASYTIPNTSWPTGIVVAIGVISGQFSGSLWLNGIRKSHSRYTTPATQNVSSMGGASDVTGLLSIRYARQLNDSEVASLSANPWQIFKSQSRRIFVASAGGDVSLSITGQSLTANLGALSASVTSSVTGNQTTLQQGTITANVSQTLTGQAISLVQGSVSSDVSTVITGQTVSLAQGSVTDASSGNVTKALSGQSLSVSQGALTANISAGLTGQAAVISNGTVFQAGSDVTKALTGQQLSIALGVLLEKKTIARPSSDTTAGAWLPSAGSSLYATLDEVSPDDADYIYTNSVSTCKIALNAVADPLTSSGQIVSYRVWSPNSNGLTVRLMQGATEIASWTHTVLPTSPTTYQQTLTAGQCDAITDYSTLAIQLESV